VHYGRGHLSVSLSHTPLTGHIIWGHIGRKLAAILVGLRGCPVMLSVNVCLSLFPQIFSLSLFLLLLISPNVFS